jgi:monothiol glutaredoxin
MLKILEVNFQGVNVLEDQNLREGIKIFSDWPTIPQLYIKKEFVGGCDIVKEMYENGELKKILEDKGINFKK